MIDKKLLEILACPKCKGELIYTNNQFVCIECRLLYKVEDDIPNFLIDEAEHLTGEEIKEILNSIKTEG